MGKGEKQKKKKRIQPTLVPLLPLENNFDWMDILTRDREAMFEMSFIRSMHDSLKWVF